MNKILLEKLKESLMAVLPITALIIILNFVLPSPSTGPQFLRFIIGALLLIGGMVLYSLGSEISLAPIGEIVGNKVTSTKKIPLILLIGFVIGVMVTVAEPDLIVLGNQLGSIKYIVIITIALGVGIFLMIALLRIFLKLNLNLLLIGLYAAVFILAIFVDNKYLALSFDSGGVTTGAITVPFIMALGVGVASVFSGKDRNENSFGVVAICSVGPILLMLLLCIIFKPDIEVSTTTQIVTGYKELLPLFAEKFTHCLKEVAIALLPISAFFFVMNAVFIKLPAKRITRIAIGLVYTYIGLSLFLTGVNAGFMDMGFNLGERLANLDNNWLLIPVGMVVGALMVLAEPAVHVLAKQVEEISDGNIKERQMLIALSVSIMFSIGLGMLRIIANIPIYYILIPGYGLALILSFFVPKTYTAIAFDSGGVASGPMAATFMLPLAIGAAMAFGGKDSVLYNAYGIVAFIAMTPLITIQIMGLADKIKSSRKTKIPQSVLRLFDSDIIELNTDR